MFYTRDVIFNELKCGFEEQAQREPQRLVYLEYPDEPSETTDHEPSVPVLHSERERRQPDFYGYNSNLTSVKEPQSVREALTSPKWVNAVRTLRVGTASRRLESCKEQVGFQSENQS